MRRGDDAAGGGVAKDFREARHRQAAALDQIGKHLPRSDRWQLIHIADEKQRGMIRQRLQHSRH